MPHPSGGAGVGESGVPVTLYSLAGLNLESSGTLLAEKSKLMQMIEPIESRIENQLIIESNRIYSQEVVVDDSGVENGDKSASVASTANQNEQGELENSRKQHANPAVTDPFASQSQKSDGIWEQGESSL